jgi:hypothetical protein
MKKISMLVLAAMLLATGCNSNSSSSKKTKAEECISPHNPYNDGGGHDAGFNWAEENGGDCNGNSDSFNEGCSEYHRQLSVYNECIANSRK